MTTPLRPMNLGEILDRTFQIYRSRFLVFVGIAAVPALAMMAVEIADGSWLHASTSLQTSQRGRESLWNFAHSLMLYHVSAFLGLLVLPALVHVASCAILDKATSFRAALQLVAARWKCFLWLAFLKLAVQLVIPEILASGLFVVLGVVGYLAKNAFNDQGQVGLVVLMFAIPVLMGLVLFLWSASWLSLAIPTASLEQIQGLKALRRSWQLTRGSRLRILAAWISLATLAILLAVGVICFSAGL